MRLGQRQLILDAAWASLTGSLSGGVVLAAFALELGATPFEVGVLAAIPFICQAAQLSGVALVERIRERKRIGVIAVGIARIVILLLAVLPLLGESWPRLGMLISAQFAICAFGSVGGCAINSWMHQLLPRAALGSFFGRQLFAATSFACLGTLAAGLLVDHPPAGSAPLAYALCFAAAGVAGAISTAYLARVPEPPMGPAGPSMATLERLRAPVADRPFRRVLVLLAAWNLASNVAAPFLTVYLIQQLGYGLTTVTSLWVLSQLANVLTIYLWGRLSDRLSNKAVLSVALPAYFACLLSLVFIDATTTASTSRLVALAVMHFVMGAATGGIGLAAGNLGLKFAPQGQATAYLAMTGLVSAIVGGVAPIVAGMFAQGVAQSELSVVMRWTSPDRRAELAVLSFAHWEFLFAISCVLGLYVMHALSRIDEGDQISEHRVMQEFALEALRTVNHLSSIGGVLGDLFPFQRLAERRRRVRPEKSDS